MLVGVQIALLVALIVVPPAEHWPTPAWLVAIASVFTLGGMVVVVMAALRLGRTFSGGPGGTLQTGGLHRWVRHPLYSGLLVVVVGVVLRSGNVATLAIGGVLVVVIRHRAVREEEALERRFPSYAAYAATTPRFLPRPQRPRRPG